MKFKKNNVLDYLSLCPHRKYLAALGDCKRFRGLSSGQSPAGGFVLSFPSWVDIPSSQLRAPNFHGCLSSGRWLAEACEHNTIKYAALFNVML